MFMALNLDDYVSVDDDFILNLYICNNKATKDVYDKKDKDNLVNHYKNNNYINTY